MRDTRQQRTGVMRRCVCIGLGGFFVLSSCLLAPGGPWRPGAWTVSAHAAERHKGRSSRERTVELAPFMIRNAYHVATLYHAAQAARWELAAYQAEELEENVTQAARAAGSYTRSLTDYRQEYVKPLQQAIAARDAVLFHTAFQRAVDGCNDCHKATKHAFITIPHEPPPLSIFVFPSRSQ